MGITNFNSGTRIDEIAEEIYRIHKPIPPSRFPGGFSFNQYLIVDEEPLLFHTGWRKLFPLVKEAIATVLPVARLRYIAFSHYEADECGALNDLLAIAPDAAPLCGKIAAMTSIDDIAYCPPRVLEDGEKIRLGKHVVRWCDTPHLPHGWDCGYLFECITQTLLCGDLFTQGGSVHPPITDKDILAASERMRQQFDYFSHTPRTRELLQKLAATEPTTLACMHGAAWRGNGAKLLLSLADELESSSITSVNLDFVS